MSALRLGWAVALLVTGLHAPAWAEPTALPAPDETPAPAVVSPAAVPAPGAPADGLGAPSLGQAGLRLLGAGTIVGVLLAVTLLALRRLLQPGGGPMLAGARGWFRRAAPAAPADPLEVVERRPVGPKESVCVVRVGSERFLIGVTSSRVSLLGRLDGARPVAGVPREPAPADFARELAGAVVARYPAPDPAPVPALTEASVQALLSRSRERLARLGADAARSTSGHA
jgi:hypothetical protein